MSKRRPAYTLMHAIALIMSAQVPLQANAQSLPAGMTVDQGTAALNNPAADHLQIQQSSARAVLRWDSFNVGVGQQVQFQQPDQLSATLNIVSSATSSTLAGVLNANGSVYLINPHGITVTPYGSVNTGGAFIASTLGLNSTDFMNGAAHLAFNGNGGLVSNQGSITAQDVLLLGSRASNAGTIVAASGRVALGSASQATLDLNGNGFLQVLAPATADGSDALVSNSGTIHADGGLIQLRAATARNAIRDAINMPGSLRATSVSGRNGAIVFEGGEGGDISSTGNIDTRPDNSSGSGGSVNISSRVLAADFNNIQIGNQGALDVSVNNIQIARTPSSRENYSLIKEVTFGGGLFNLLRNGTDVTLRANNDIEFYNGLVITQQDLAPETQGTAGDLNLIAGRSILLNGSFNMLSGNWHLIANATPAVEADRESGMARIEMYSFSDPARFLNLNSHLTLEIQDGDGRADRGADTLQLPIAYGGTGLTARIASTVVNYDEADIQPRGDIAVSGTLTLDGHLRSITQTGDVFSLSGQRVDWVTEKTGGRLAGSALRFIENNQVTRFGVGGSGTTGPGVDAIRLQLGSTGSVTRVYGDAEPQQSDLGSTLLSIASHNNLDASNTDLATILTDGSVDVTGPGSTAGVGSHTLQLAANNNIAFAGNSGGEDGGQSGEEGNSPGAYWIDLNPTDASATVQLNITPRPLTATVLNPSYTYGSPQTAVSFGGVVNNDDVVPVIATGNNSLSLTADGSGYALPDNFSAGSYSYSVSGITGTASGNYTLTDIGGSGTLTIDPKPINYTASVSQSTYGTTPSLRGNVSGLLSSDDVTVELSLFSNGNPVAVNQRTPAGIYQSRVIGLAGTAAANYVLNISGGVDSTHTVNAKAVTWQLSDTNSEYGTLASLPVAQIVGLLNGDDVSAQTLVNTPAPLAFNTPVGNYTLRVETLTGSDAGNYTLAASGHSPATLRINPKPITWQTQNSESTYGTLAEFQPASLIGVLDGDAITATTHVFNSSGAQIALASRTDAGQYAIRVNSLQGEDISNYQLASSGNTEGVLTIRPITLTWSVSNANVMYGNNPANMQATLNGVLPGDDLTAEVAYQADGQLNRLQGSSRIPVGTYTLQPYNLTGSSAGNYQLAVSGNTPGTLTVSPRELNWTVGDGTVVYGDAINISSYNLQGVLSGETVLPVFGADDYSGDITTRPNAGTWDAYIINLTGEHAGNYRLSDPFSGSNTKGRLTVSPRPIVYNLFQQFQYGDLISPNLRPDGLVEGDAAPVLTYRLLRNNQVIGTYISVLPAIASESQRLAVGTYTLQPVSLSAIGNNPLNYSLTTNPGTGQPFDAGRLIVNPRDITYSILLRAIRDDTHTGPDNRFFADYSALRPEDFNDPSAARAVLDNVLPGDQVSLGVFTQALPSSVQGYIPAGTYSWNASGTLEGADAANYRFAPSGHSSARLTINPLPIWLEARIPNSVYGDTGGLQPQIQLFETNNSQAARAAFDNGYISVAPGSVGVYLPDTGSHVLSLPDRLAAGRYSVSATNLGLLMGPDAENFSPTLRGFDFVVSPRLLDARALNPTFTYGDSIRTTDLFELAGVLPGDDAQLDPEATLNLVNSTGNRTRTTDGWRVDAGEYNSSLTRSMFSGEHAANYTLPNVDGTLTVERRPLSFDLQDTYYYGEFNPFPIILNVIDADRVALTWSSLFSSVVSDAAGNALAPGQQPNAGIHVFSATLRNPDAANGTVLRNYVLPDAEMQIQIEPRPLVATFDNTALIYGSSHEIPFTFATDARLLDSNIAILPEDDVVADLYVSDRQGNDDLTFDEYLRVGNYRFRVTGFTGSDAGNYRLSSEIGRVGELNVFPRELSFTNIEADQTHTYGDAISLAELQGILPRDQVNVDIMRHGSGQDASPGNQQSIPVQNSLVNDTSALNVGTYQYQLTHLSGVDSGNYRLISPAQTSITIEPRQIVYAIDPVIGQYGNYKGCEDPRIIDLCNASVDSNGVAFPDIWAPLELGQVRFFNWIEGDDLRGNILLVDPRDGSTLTLDDKPTPGTYLQVVSELTGTDANNYRVASTGSSPSILTMTPRWVQWQTYGGFFSPDTGLVALGSLENENTIANPLRASLRPSTTNPHGVDLEHLSSVSPVVRLFRNGDPLLDWTPENPTDPTAYQNFPNGIYSANVVDLTGEYSDYYRPLPAEFLTGTRLGFFAVISSVSQFGVEALSESVIAARDRQYERVNSATPIASNEAIPEITPPQTGTNQGSNSQLDVTQSPYLNVLADYGITGVTVSAGTGTEVQVEYQMGAGFVEVGARADAAGRLQLNYQGLSGDGSVSAGVSARTGIEGSAGSLGYGQANVGANAGAFAKGSFNYTYKDGKFVLATETLTGATGSATASTSLSGQYGSANVATTVYPPGTVGAGFSAGGGFDDGELSFNIRMSLALGFAGFTFDLGGSIDINVLGDAFMDAGRWIGGVVEGFCTGFGGCAGPSDQERYINQQWQASNLRHSPTTRYAALRETRGSYVIFDETVSDNERSMMQQNDRFYSEFNNLVTSLEQFYERQANYQTQFQQALEGGRSSTAIQMMSQMMVRDNIGGLISELGDQAAALGVKFQMVNGIMRLVDA